MDIINKKIENRINLIIGIIFCILIVVCIIFYNYCVKNHDKLLAEGNEEDKDYYKNVEISTQLFDIREYPKVSCTTSTMKLAEKFMANFTRQDESELEIDVLKRQKTYEKLIKKETDLIITTDPLKEEMQKAKEDGTELVSYKIANEGLVFLVNEHNKVDNLTLKQVQKIYTGGAKKWSELEGDNEEIIPCQRNENSDSQLAMKTIVMDGLEMIDILKENRIADTSTLVNAISNYEKNPGAIGYLYYNKIIYNKGIKFLSVNGVPPTYENIKNETYPIKAGYYIIIRKSDEENENIKKLVDVILSDRGKKIIEEAGYISIKEE